MNDLLIVAFDDSKLVFSEYSPIENSISELFIINIDEHLIARDDFSNQKQQYLGNGKDTILKISESYNSVVALFFGELVLFGTLQSDRMKIFSDKPFNYFIFSPAKQLNLIGPILDITFLPGYSQPTVAILQQNLLLPIGHAAKVMHSCSLSVLAIDESSKTVAILWTQRNLPHDSLKFIDLRTLILSNGAVVVSKNSLLAVQQTSIQGLATNSFASVTVSNNIALRSWSIDDVGYELDGACWAEISSSGSIVSLLGFLKCGHIILVHICLYLKDVLTVPTFKASVVANQHSNTRFCISSPKTESLFVGSFHGFSYLYQVKKLILEANGCLLNYVDFSSAETFMKNGNCEKKKRKFCSENVDFDVGLTNEFLCQEEYLYNSTGDLNTVEAFWDIQLVELDKFEVLGPLLHGCFTKRDDFFSQSDEISWERISNSRNTQKSISTAASYIAERELKDSLLISAGLDKEASLHKLCGGVGLGKICARNFPGATRFHSISVGMLNFMVVSYENRSRTFVCREDHSKSSEKGVPELKFVELSTEDTGFVSTSNTLVLCNLYESQPTCDSPRFVVVAQVIPTGVRLIKIFQNSVVDTKIIKDLQLREGEDIGGMDGVADEVISTADVCEGHFVVLTNLSTVLVYKYNQYLECAEIILRKPFYESNCYFSFTEEERELRLFNSAIISASLYYGEFSVLSTMSIKIDNCSKEVNEVESEYSDLYGEGLRHSNRNRTEISSSSRCSSFAYLITSEANGFVTILCLENGISILRTRQFLLQNDFVLADEFDNSFREDGLHMNQYIIETKFACLQYGYNSHLDSLQTQKVLVLQFQSGEIVVYSVHEESAKIVSFNKTVAKTVHNKRSTGVKITPKNVSQHSEGESSFLYLESEDFIHRFPQTIVQMKNLETNSDCLLISANDPLVLTVEKGYPLVMTIGFPELPYINYGHYTVLPFYLMGKTLIGTMWIEYEDIESFKNHIHMRNRAQKQSNLGIYYVLPKQSQLLLPSSNGYNISLQKVNVRKTVHKVVEMQKLTDNKTEHALLEKKTFLLLASFPKFSKFNNSVVGSVDNETEDVLFERYFPILDSFQQPDASVAPSPSKIDRIFNISLVQNGNGVDTFEIPPNENVLDAAVVYFTIDKSPAQTNISQNILGPTPAKVLERRVFVLVSTLEKDKRGEDSQGNGRLLLLGLDYAMFDDGGIVESIGTNDVNQPELSKTSVDSGGFEDVSHNLKIPIDVVPPEFIENATAIKSNSTGVSTIQQRFLGAIQPKLRLLWTGPGPGSILQQMPAKTNAKGADGWSNYVVSTVGATLYIYKFNSITFEMDQVAFYFAQFYITSATVVKTFIIIGDMFHSVQLLYFREEDFSIHLISKDFDKRVITKTELILDDSKLGIITADDRGNIQLFQQTNKKLESIGGSRLLLMADFFIGAEISFMCSHDLLYADQLGARKPLKALSQPPPPPPRTRKGSNFPLQAFGTRMFKCHPDHRRSSLLFGSLEGSIGNLVPVDEKIFKRLALLQQIMSVLLPSLFALNPKEYRAAKCWWTKLPKDGVHTSSGKRLILDGCLINRYMFLNTALQDELASLMGTTAYIIRENLHEIDYVSRCF